MIPQGEQTLMIWFTGMLFIGSILLVVALTIVGSPREIHNLRDLWNEFTGNTQ